MENSLTKWTIGLSERLKLWRELRARIATMSPELAIQESYQWWRTSPAVRRTFDPWKIETWPNPWNLLYQEEQCSNSIILGAYYTLVLAGIDQSRFQLSIVNDIEQKCNCMALIIDSATALTYNKVMSAEDTEVLEILNIFTETELSSLVE